MATRKKPALDVDSLDFEAPTCKDNERFLTPKARSNFRVDFCGRKNGTKDFRPCASKLKRGDEGCDGCIRFSNYVAGLR